MLVVLWWSDSLRTRLIVPVKRLQMSKTSFSGVFSEDQRKKFTLVMLEDILNVVEQVEELEPSVVTPDDEVAEFAKERGVMFKLEPNLGLNGALKIAISQSIEDGCDQVLILPVDVPLVRSRDLENILDLAEGDRCVVATPSEEKGTNALLLRPPDILDLRFGGESFPDHISEARSRGINLEVYFSDCLKRDMDSPEDLLKVETLGKGSRTHSWLSEVKKDQ
ncbi:MAG: 2-phospho-L-lactate guanylyltransferase [Candidatus Hadarchaeia archaeon]